PAADARSRPPWWIAPYIPWLSRPPAVGVLAPGRRPQEDPMKSRPGRAAAVSADTDVNRLRTEGARGRPHEAVAVTQHTPSHGMVRAALLPPALRAFLSFPAKGLGDRETGREKE